MDKQYAVIGRNDFDHDIGATRLTADINRAPDDPARARRNRRGVFQGDRG